MGTKIKFEWKYYMTWPSYVTIVMFCKDQKRNIVGAFINLAEGRKRTEELSKSKQMFEQLYEITKMT